MAYQSLYRRHRPLTFADMTGQEHITRTLSNALSGSRLAHAYLFSGPRGTGKTTVAKILARTMNCDHYPAPEPCGECKPCLNISGGVSIDVIEMDAASNRGIDEIRELRERTRYASAESRFKVYIIDEAHMLTTEACNAFLKTLEEPPGDVVFVLATTDPSRLPSTIVSRCQRFDFHLLTVEQIHQRLKHVLGQENWYSDQEAVRMIARLADGSLRDALGILEQCSAYAEDRITAEHVRIVTGATRTETIDDLIRAIVDNDPAFGFETVEQIIYSGRDLQLLMRDLIFVFSRLLLPGDSGKKGQAAEEKNGLEILVDKYRGRVPDQTLLEMVELTHEIRGELRHAHFPQYLFEVAVIRLIRLLHGSVQASASLQPGMESISKEDPAFVVTETAQKGQGAPRKAKNMEKQKTESCSDYSIEYNGQNAQKAELETDLAEGKDRPATDVPEMQGAETGEQVAGEKKAESETKKSFSGEGLAEEGSEAGKLEKLKSAWPKILEEIKKKQKSTAAWMEPAVLEDFRGELICLSYTPEYTIHQIRLMEDSHRKLVEEVLSNFCRIPVRVKAEITEDISPSQFASSDVSIREDSSTAQTECNADNKGQEGKQKNSIQQESQASPGINEAGEPKPENNNLEENNIKEKEDNENKNKEKKAPGADDALEYFEGKIIDPD
ncbi:MAG: DNA polymerase III subunit gamma/tau [Bacillota bacterium]